MTTGKRKPKPRVWIVQHISGGHVVGVFSDQRDAYEKCGERRGYTYDPEGHPVESRLAGSTT